MAEPKTKLTKESVKDFLNKVEPEEKRQDSFTLLEMFEKITGEKAVMWGDEHCRLWSISLQIRKK